jgi:hypothetical protein
MMVVFWMPQLKSFTTEVPTDGGLLDPTLGVRYSGVRVPSSWNLVLEAAIKVPVQGRRPYLSSGRVDAGLQASLQRFGERNAFYKSAQRQQHA